MTIAPPLPTVVQQSSSNPGRTSGSRLFDLADGGDEAPARINGIGYGNSGVGKTALYTALPWQTDRWGSKDNYKPDGKYMVYIAWDAGSETLLSVSPEDRKHLVVVTPRVERTADGQLSLNPYRAATEIANADWSVLVPEAKTLLWDGGTRLAEQILRSVANTGATVSQTKKEAEEFRRLSFGVRGEPGYMALPIVPDYGMAQFSLMQWGEQLRQQPMNVFVICVSDYYKPEGGSLDGDTVGGPALVGTKIIPKFMAGWDNVFRLSVESETVMKEGRSSDGKPGPPQFERVSKRILWTEQHGIWNAKIRRPISDTNPLARVELTTTPRDFWKLFDASGMGV